MECSCASPCTWTLLAILVFKLNSGANIGCYRMKEVKSPELWDDPFPENVFSEHRTVRVLLKVHNLVVDRQLQYCVT